VQLPYNQVDSILLIVLGTIGFVETLIEVNESIGEATLNVNMRLNSSIQFEIMLFLFANTMIDSSGMGNATQYFHQSSVIICVIYFHASAGQHYCLPGIEDYQQIENMSLHFNDTQRSQSFSLMIFEDDVPEEVEELNVTLSLQDSSLANQVVVEPAVATVRIQDDDSKFSWFL